MDYGYGHTGTHWGAIVVGIVVLVVVMGALAWIVVTLLGQKGQAAPTQSAAGPAGPAGPVGSEALRILDERFARGEIDAEEYQGRRRLLTGKE